MNTDKLLTSIASVFIFFLLGLYSRGENLVINGDFEAGSDMPSSWIVTGEKGALTYEKSGGKTGEKCVKLDNTSKETETAIRQMEVVLSPDRQYKLSGYVKTENFSGTGGIAVINAGWAWASKFLKPEQSTSDWVYVEEIFTPAPSSSGKYQVVFCVWKNSLGKIWVDGIKLEPVETNQADVKK